MPWLLMDCGRALVAVGATALVAGVALMALTLLVWPPSAWRPVREEPAGIGAAPRGDGLTLASEGRPRR